MTVRTYSHQAEPKAKANTFFDLCRCSMWTANWILWEPIWKWRRFHFRFCTVYTYHDRNKQSHINTKVHLHLRKADTKAIFYLYRPQRSCVNVIFSQACVKNSVHGGGGEVSASLYAGIHPPPGQTTPPPSRWLLQRWGILLECILVDLCRCSVWTLNWVLCEPIWMWCRFRFCVNINEP